MKINLAVVISLTFATGFAAGVLGGNLISPAHAAAVDEIIYVDGPDQAVGDHCNFNKSIVRGNLYTICVKK
jgi:hypothetical protein